MKQLEKLYEGKAKEVFATDDPTIIRMHYKDDATAFNGIKKAQIENKGVLNNKITTILFKILEKNGIPTHYIKTLDDRNMLCQKVKIFPLEVIVRNIIAGSMAKRLDIPEGTHIDNVVYELCYKKDKLGDPLINEHHAVALKIATYDELKEIYDLTMKINEILKKTFASIGITLVDFKVEFGKNSKGQILLADEISPDTCRFWDSKTNDKLDKDRFRRDLGNVIEAYQEIYRRLLTLKD